MPDPDESVGAFAATLEGQGGSRLAVWLAPLHADPRREAFEAGSLERRLGLGEGQPWRLRVHWDPPTSGEPLADGAALRLGPLQVLDAQGTAQQSIPGSPDQGPEAVADPLRTVLAPPAGELRPGQAVDYVLWGREPGAGGRLAGLLPAPGTPEAKALEAATGLAGPLLLEHERVHRSDLWLPLARLDRSSVGKNAAGRPSDGAHGASDGEPDPQPDQR